MKKKTGLPILTHNIMLEPTLKEKNPVKYKVENSSKILINSSKAQPKTLIAC